MIQERAAGFQAGRHAGDVDLRHDVAGEVGLHIDRSCAGDEVAIGAQLIRFEEKLGRVEPAESSLKLGGVQPVPGFIISFLVVGGYVVEELRFGNAHFFVVALMVFAYDRVEAGRVVTPSLALALAIATKLTPLALLAYFAVRRRAAVCLTTVVMLGSLVVLPAVVMGTAGNVRQLRAFATYAMEKVDESDNYSLRGIVVRYLTLGLARCDSSFPTRRPFLLCLFTGRGHRLVARACSRRS